MHSEADESEPFYHVDENGRLTWTDEGLRSYRKRFARFGIRIESIATFEDYKTAMHLSASAFLPDLLEGLEERCAGKPYHEVLVAALIGSPEDLERARRRYATRRSLRVISGGSATPR